MKFYNKFNFVGKLKGGNNGVGVEVKSKHTNFVGKRANLSVVADNGLSRQFLNIFGEKNPETIRIFDNSYQKGYRDIPFEDRFNEEIVWKAPAFNKIVIDVIEDSNIKEQCIELRSLIFNAIRDNLDDDAIMQKIEEHNELAQGKYMQFLHPVDAIEWLENNLDKYEDDNFYVTGDMSANKGNKLQVNYNPSIISLDNDSEPKIQANMGIYFDKNTKTEYDEDEGVLRITGAHTMMYDEGRVQGEKNKYFELPFVMRLNKGIDDIERAKAIIEFVKDNLTVDDGVYVDAWTVGMFEGVDEPKNTMANLTEHQRRMIDLGFADESDFVVSEVVTEYRLIAPLTYGDFKEGRVKTQISETMFQRNTVPYADSGGLKETAQSSVKTETKEQSTSDVVAQLFSDM